MLVFLFAHVEGLFELGGLVGFEAALSTHLITTLEYFYPLGRELIAKQLLRLVSTLLQGHCLVEAARVRVVLRQSQLVLGSELWRNLARS